MQEKLRLSSPINHIHWVAEDLSITPTKSVTSPLLHGPHKGIARRLALIPFFTIRPGSIQFCLLSLPHATYKPIHVCPCDEYTVVLFPSFLGKGFCYGGSRSYLFSGKISPLHERDNLRFPSSRHAWLKTLYF